MAKRKRRNVTCEHCSEDTQIYVNGGGAQTWECPNCHQPNHHDG